MKIKELKTALKLILVSLAAIGLLGCETLEIAHNPIGCIDKSMTRLSERFTDEELNNIPDNVFDTYEEHISMYQQRILSQCEVNKEHDRLHKN